MIRTALLAGIFLVLLSLAYSRSGPNAGPSLLPAPEEEAVSVKAVPPVKHIAQAHAPAVEPVRKAEAHVEAPLETAPAPQAIAPAAVEAPVAEAPVAKAPAAPAPVVAQDTPKSAGQPVSLLPPEMQPKQAAATALAPLLPPEAAAPAAAAPPVVAQAPAPPAAPPAVTPAAEIPTVQVAARTAAAPYDVPSGSAHVAVADPGAAKPADAPKFMTPQERSKELYRLAREMEDTFIHKLAR
jgi:hypothetical protein